MTGWLGHLVGYWPLHIMLLALVAALVTAGRRAALAVAGLDLLLVAVWAAWFFARYGDGSVAGFFTGQIGRFALIAAGLILAVAAGGLMLKRRR